MIADYRAYESGVYKPLDASALAAICEAPLCVCKQNAATSPMSVADAPFMQRIERMQSLGVKGLHLGVCESEARA